jgi:hypothetical protein
LSRENAGKHLFLETDSFAVSLGRYIFWSKTMDRNQGDFRSNKAHEYGHAIQSVLLGPLYLPIIGVTSLSRVAYDRIYRLLWKRQWGGYYKGFPEHWADRLGNKRR